MSSMKYTPGGLRERVVSGWLFVCFGSFLLTSCVYATIVSKLLPFSENVFLSAVQNDRYYCFLLPLTLPIIVTFVYFRWLSMKFFKHA